jgi:hypothetical protein
VRGVSAPLREIERRRLPALADEIAEHALAAEKAWRDALGHAIAAGKKLHEAKALVKHGEWGAWLAENFPGSDRTARLYMRLATHSARVADLPTVRDAVAQLAAPKQREAVTDDAATDDDDAFEREVAKRVAALRERTGGTPTNEHVANAQLHLTVAQLYEERGADAALALAAAYAHLGDEHRELAAAAARLAAACLADPWDEDGDAKAAFKQYELLLDGGEA